MLPDSLSIKLQHRGELEILAQNYNDTIHKMATPFEMRAGLPKKEPKMLEDWENNHVYEKMIEAEREPGLPEVCRS